RFRKRVAETRLELKEVRRSLRQDAEALVFWTKVVNIALMPILVALAGLAIVYYHQESSERAENVATLGKPLLPEVKAADIAAIRIVEPKATLTIQRKDDGWVIAERRGFPADVAKVR